jgi:hypothetical protein
VLDDYVYLIHGLIAGYEATAKHPYLLQAEALMDQCLAQFYDQQEGGFFDTADEVLGARLKRIEDVPHPSPNGTAALLLQKLSLMTGKEAYDEAAKKTLRLFSGLAQSLSIHAGAYFCALDAYFRMLKLTVEAAPDSALAREARALAGIRQVTIVYSEDHARVIPCKQNACLEPISDPHRLKEIGEKL